MAEGLPGVLRDKTRPSRIKPLRAEVAERILKLTLADPGETRPATTADAPVGPSAPRSTVLTPVEESMIVEFRRRTLLPYQIRIVLTDNGTPAAHLPKNRSGPTARLRGHMFDRVCREHGI